MIKYHMHYGAGFRSFTLDETEHKILNSCRHFDGKEATNSAVKARAKVDLKSADVGLIMSRLRAAKLIDYRHIETGRMAVGSGRYVLKTLSDYFGSVVEGEEKRLP